MPAARKAVGQEWEGNVMREMEVIMGERKVVEEWSKTCITQALGKHCFGNPFEITVNNHQNIHKKTMKSLMKNVFILLCCVKSEPEKEINLTNIARCMCTYPGGYSELTDGYLRWSVFITVFIFFFLILPLYTTTVVDNFKVWNLAMSMASRLQPVISSKFFILRIKNVPYI